jgi:osmotically-inducible protein OsmY
LEDVKACLPQLEEDYPGVEDLEVSLADGVATLKGNTTDQAAAAKAIFMAGNVLGIQEVKADELKAPPATDSLKAGDTAV